MINFSLNIVFGIRKTVILFNLDICYIKRFQQRNNFSVSPSMLTTKFHRNPSENGPFYPINLVVRTTIRLFFAKHFLRNDVHLNQ